MHRYGEHLDDAALGLLAETTGRATRSSARDFFASRPWEVDDALGSTEAGQLLSDRASDGALTPALTVAIGVHTTALDVIRAGWSITDPTLVDSKLLDFCGQQWAQRFVVDLLTSMLPVRDTSPETRGPLLGGTPGSLDRLNTLIDFANSVDEVERCGVLRWLGDEALFTVSMRAGVASETVLDRSSQTALRSIVPRALHPVIAEPAASNLLLLYLQFGSVWYRMAATSMVHRTMPDDLVNVARDFETARRFLVRVVQERPAVQALFPHDS